MSIIFETGPAAQMNAMVATARADFMTTPFCVAVVPIERVRAFQHGRQLRRRAASGPAGVLPRSALLSCHRWTHRTRFPSRLSAVPAILMRMRIRSVPALVCAALALVAGSAALHAQLRSE